MKLYKILHHTGGDIYPYLFASDDELKDIDVEKVAINLFDFEPGVLMNYIVDEICEFVELELVGNLEVFKDNKSIGTVGAEIGS